MLDAGHPVLADVKARRKLNLGETRCLAQFAQPVCANLVDHALLVRIDSLTIDRTLVQQFIEGLGHGVRPSVVRPGAR